MLDLIINLNLIWIRYMINITIANKSYKVKEAKTDEEREKGLNDVKELPEDEGMLFYMPDEQSQYVFTMEDMSIPLDIIFINQDQEVVSVSENCQPGEEQVVSSTEDMDEDDYIAYVLEVNPDSGIKVGDELEFEDDDQPTMKVLGSDGSVQYELWGGERIFSRRNTRILIKKAKKAEETNDDKDYKALGRYIFKCIKIQDNREPDYVQLDTKEK